MPIEPKPPTAIGPLISDAPPHWQHVKFTGVRYGFFGRAGGVSTGIYASLNAGPGSRDDPEAVKENRRRIAATFGLEPTHLLSLHQVHSPIVHVVDAPWPSARPEGDALVTKTPGIALSILTADCTPVLFADKDARVIGAAHAGWKGALSGVLEATVERMRALGATKIAAAIGPTIQQKSYEVGPEFEARFLATDATFARYFAPGNGDRLLFDLPQFCADRLAALDVAVENLGLDTLSNPHLFSHRRSVRENAGDYGRNCAAIALP